MKWRFPVRVNALTDDKIRGARAYVEVTKPATGNRRAVGG